MRTVVAEAARKIELSRSVVGFRRFAKPHHGELWILRSTLAEFEAQAKSELGFDMTLLSSAGKQSHCLHF